MSVLPLYLIGTNHLPPALPLKDALCLAVCLAFPKTVQAHLLPAALVLTQNMVVAAGLVQTVLLFPSGLVGELLARGREVQVSTGALVCKRIWVLLDLFDPAGAFIPSMCLQEIDCRAAWRVEGRPEAALLTMSESRRTVRLDTRLPGWGGLAMT